MFGIHNSGSSASGTVERESNNQCIANTIPVSARPNDWRASRTLRTLAKGWSGRPFRGKCSNG